MLKSGRWLWLVLSVALIAACGKLSQVQFVGTDLSGADFGKSFHLTDHSGKARSLEDFRGKAVVLFFGYTHCPDICPTTMQDVANALKLLGERKQEVQVIFVTLDPERDTQALLAKYVPSFDPSFLGLYGNADETAKTAQDFKVFYQKQMVAGKEGYTIDHSAGTYVFDKQGRLRLFMNFGEKPKDIAQDLSLIL